MPGASHLARVGLALRRRLELRGQCVRRFGLGIRARSRVRPGLDYQITPKSLIGFAAGGGELGFSVPDRATSGSVDAFHASLYGAWRIESAYATGILSYDHFNNSESRQAVIPGVTLPAPQFVDGNFTIPGYDENLSGNFASQSISGHFETGYKFGPGGFQATPFVGLEFGSLNTGAFTETNKSGPSVIGLSYSARTIDTLRASSACR